jgi:hypothetical protein
MPMPIDLLVEYTDGTMEAFRCARCITKRESNACGKRTVLSDWTWAASNYDFTIGNQRAQSRKSPSIQRING